MKKYLKQGDTWRPILTVTEIDEDGVETVYDCTGHTVKLWIKEKESGPEIQKLDIIWTDQAGGIGCFSLTEEISAAMLGRYWYDVILYETVGNTIVKTLIQDRLIVRETLGISKLFYTLKYQFIKAY